MLKFYIVLILYTSTLFSFIIAPENPTESTFPGGYISIGLQFGKDDNAEKFRSYQINIGTSIGSPLMIGLTFGKRFYSNNQSYYYFDLQGNIILLLGGGIGITNKGNNLYLRKKIFGGLGPLMYSKDWTTYRKKKNIVKNSGVVFTLPLLTVFGNSFHP